MGWVTDPSKNTFQSVRFDRNQDFTSNSNNIRSSHHKQQFDSHSKSSKSNKLLYIILTLIILIAIVLYNLIFD